MKPTDIAKNRLLNQQLSGSKFKTAYDIVSYFGAMQAQEYALTKWSLGLRSKNFKDQDIEQEFTKGAILRTHLLRPTWHFVAAQDIQWLLKLTAPRVNNSNAYMYRKLELDVQLFNQCNNIIIKCLQGNQQLTRDEINIEFKKNKIIAEGHRLSYIMMRSELDGIICSGARRGNQFTYALLEERISAFKINKKSMEESLAEITKRYFLSRGPATIKDFSTWSGLTISDCKKGIQLIKSDLDQANIEHEDYFFLSSRPNKVNASQHLHLLPPYDEYIMGYKDRSAILNWRNNITPTPTFLYDSMIILDGQVIGTWKRIVNKKAIDLSYNLFKPLPKKQLTLFEEAIQHYTEFTQLPVNY